MSMFNQFQIIFLITCLLLPGVSNSIESEPLTVKELAEKNQAKEEVIKALEEEPESGPYDEHNRSTPRASILGLADAIKKKDYTLATNYLDLRNLPFSNDKKDNFDALTLVKQLSIVASRSMAIDIENLSDNPMGHKNDGLPSYRDRITTMNTDNGPVDILIQRVPRKDGVFIWKISNATVALIPQLNSEFGYGVIGESLSRFLPSYVISGFEIWQIVLLVILAAIGFSIAYVITFLLVAFLQKHQNYNKQRLQKFIVGPVRLLILVIFMRATFELIAPTLVMKAIFETKTILILSILWVMLGVIDFVIYRLADRMKRHGQDDGVVLLKPASTTLKLMIALTALISWIDNLGFEVTALIAGLGVGGIAVALAAQKSLEDLIGAIIIYVSRPVRVGDFCKFGNTVGTVEEIGLRATQIRTLARSVVHIPNSKFASSEIENLTQRNKILYRTRLNLSYNTTAEQVRQVLNNLRQLIEKQDYIDNENSRVRFIEFGDYAQELELYVYIKTTEFSKYLEYREDINLRISDIVESANSKLVIQTKAIELNQPINN